MKAYIHLAEYALDRGLIVKVDDGGELHTVTTGASAREVIESVDQASDMFIYDGQQHVGWALCIPGLDDDEGVAGYGANDFMDVWFEEFMHVSGS